MTLNLSIGLVAHLRREGCKFRGQFEFGHWESSAFESVRMYSQLGQFKFGDWGSSAFKLGRLR